MVAVLLKNCSNQWSQSRDFILSPDQEYLIAVHQDSDNATVFKRDKASGRLTELSHDFYARGGLRPLQLNQNTC